MRMDRLGGSERAATFGITAIALAIKIWIALTNATRIF